MRTLLGLAIVVVLAGTACSAHPPHKARPLHPPANFDPTFAGAVVCSAKILSGTVVRVVDGKPGRMLTTIDVREWIKPPRGPHRVRLDTADLGKSRWSPGSRLNVVVDVDPTILPSSISRKVLSHYKSARAEATTLTCPYGPS